MPAENSPPPALIRWRNFLVVPSFHSRLQFAVEVRRAFFHEPPDRLCVEIPEPFADAVVEAVRHLPNISVVAYEAESMEGPRFIPVEPGDSIIETLRLGLELDVPVEFIDVPVPDYMPGRYAFPDDYAVGTLGLPCFYETVVEGGAVPKCAPVPSPAPAPSPALTPEAAGTGAGEAPEARARRVHRVHRDAYNALREHYMAWRLRALRARAPESRVLVTLGMAHWARVRELLEQPAPLPRPALPPVPAFQTTIYNVAPESLPRLLREIPWLTYQYERARQDAMDRLRPRQPATGLVTVDKYPLIRDIFLEAKRRYAEKYGELVSPQALGILFQYARNLALQRDKLVPSFFDLIVAAKNVVDDDYAGEVYDLAAAYPFVDRENRYPWIKLDPTPADQVQQSVRLRRHFPVEDRGSGTIRLRRRPREPRAGAWREAWNADPKHQVSYPPEDRRFESIAAFLKYKAFKLLQAHRVQVREFTTSLLDGLAIKETLRNWYRKKIYVREETPVRGTIGPVVVIFDEDEERREYEHLLSWYAEHDQESDLILYSTYPEDHLVGPGIARIELGGFLSVFPPLGYHALFDPWNAKIPFVREFDLVESLTDKRHELLLLAAALNATPEQKFILYVAERPPRPGLRQFARKRGHEILYVPLETYSGDTIKKLRVLHVLKGRPVRRYAHKYIFL